VEDTEYVPWTTTARGVVMAPFTLAKAVDTVTFTRN